MQISRGKWPLLDGKWISGQSFGCSLGADHESFGTHSESPLTENVVIYARGDGKKLTAMRLTGESCPVEGNGARVDWIGDVDETAGLRWLDAVATRYGAMISCVDCLTVALLDVLRNLDELLKWRRHLRGLNQRTDPPL